MRLDDVQMEALLPSWMRDSDDDVALSQEVDKVIKHIVDRAKLLTIWDKLDQLPDEVLDRMAWELDVSWYDTGASHETKAALIRDSDYVHAHKGTVAAVERVVAAYFGDQRIMEWFEYGGDPHHFKVFTTEPTLVAANLELFLAMLEKIKRKSSKLDGILIGLTGRQDVYLGNGARDYTYEVHAAGTDRMYAWGSAGHAEHETVAIDMGNTSPYTLEQAEQALNDERRVTPWAHFLITD